MPDLKRRVVITGMGAITPLGNNVDEFWQGLIEGRSGIGVITKFDPSQFTSRIAGEVKNFNPEQFLDKKEIKKLDPFILYAIAATQMAVEDAKLKITPGNADRIGLLIGSGIGGLSFLENEMLVLQSRGPSRISPFLIPGCIINMSAGYISMMLGIKGPNLAIATACASGNHSIGDAYKIIKRGDADVMIAGGTEAAITPLSVGGFGNMRALSRRNDQPQKASRPFDKERDGFVIAEGAGIIVLEELNFALNRGAKIYAEILGYGLNGDAYHITVPSGEGAFKCMKMALEDAGLKPTDIDYINAHGTSTPLNDLCETQAIKELFKDHSYQLLISSTKSMVGHLLGGAGGVEAIATIKTIQTGIVHPTINLDNPDPQCDLDYVPHIARKAEIRYAMSNSFGFGGTNAVLVFAKYA